ncbi:hypothetical protein E3P96_04148, partial [Wallemia ichthyophaga]
MLCASRLIPLAKSDGGVRPIAVGEIFYRLVMKVVMRTYFKPSCLHPYQLGVGTSGGVEPIVLASQLQVDKDEGQYKYMISLDFRNAFNTIDRKVLASTTFKHLQPITKAVKWAYNQPSSLLVNGDDTQASLQSSQGVRQGDPLGPLLFSLAVKDTLQDLQKILGDRAMVLAYLDDVYLFATEDVMADVEEFFAKVTCGLQLNRSKCSVVSWDDVRQHGREILGSMVGPREARAGFLRSKTAQVRSKVEALDGVHSQHQLLLLLRCIQAELRHLQRSLRTDDMLEEWNVLDTLLHEKVKKVRGSSRRQVLDTWIIGIPQRYGGLGVPLHSDVAPMAYSSMMEQACVTLEAIFHQRSGPDETLTLQRQRTGAFYELEFNKKFDTLSRDQRNVVLDSQSKLGRKWLSTIPYNKQLKLSDTEISYALHIRTLCPGKDNNCRKCGMENSVGHDDICNSRENLRTARHDYVKGLLMRF